MNDNATETLITEGDLSIDVVEVWLAWSGKDSKHVWTVVRWLVARVRQLERAYVCYTEAVQSGDIGAGGYRAEHVTELLSLIGELKAEYDRLVEAAYFGDETVSAQYKREIHQQITVLAHGAHEMRRRQP